MLLGSTYIEFDQVEVPVGNLLGEENKGFHVIMNSMLLISSHTALLYANISRLQPRAALACMHLASHGPSVC